MLDKKNKLKLVGREILSYAIIIAVVLLIKNFIAAPALVNGSSMYPTLEDKDLLLLSKLDKSYERYDIVVLDYKGEKLVKRIIGLPGETLQIKDGVLYINGVETKDTYASVTYNFDLSELGLVTIPEGTYFVMGDNRNNSIDSRRIGPIAEEDIEGTIEFSLVPPGSIRDTYELNK